MFEVVINGVYYKDNKWFSSYNARQKKSFVYFYDYDDCVKYIIDSLDYSDLQKFRLNIYSYLNENRYLKFVTFREVDLDGVPFEGIKITSPIMQLDYDEVARLLPNKSIRKKFFIYDDIKERYILKSDFINYVKFHVI